MSKNAEGNNYEVSISTSDVMKNLNVPVLNVDVKKMMKPIIAKVSEKYKLKLNNTRKISLELNAKMSTTNDIKIEKHDEINILQQYILKLEEQILSGRMPKPPARDVGCHDEGVIPAGHSLHGDSTAGQGWGNNLLICSQAPCARPCEAGDPRWRLKPGPHAD